MPGTTNAIDIPMDDLPIVLHCDVESRRVFLKAAKKGSFERQRSAVNNLQPYVRTLPGFQKKQKEKFIMSDINPPNTAVSITLPTASRDDSQAAVHAYYAEVTKRFHDIVCDSAKKKILDPNSQPEFLFIACLLFVLETMSIANHTGVGDQYPDNKRYSFDDISKVFSDERYCLMLLFSCPDREMWDWWFQYYRPSNADTRHAIFLQVQSYLDYLVEQHDSGQMTNELSTAYGMLQP